MTDGATDPSGDAATSPIARRRFARWFGALALLALLLVALGAGTAWWAVRTDTGSAWLLRQLPGVQATAPRGALLGDFEVQQLQLRLPGSADTTTLTGFGWTGLSLHPGHDGRWLRVVLDDLHANRVDVVLTPAAAASAASRHPPSDLRLPVEVELRSLRVVELNATPLGAQPVRDLRATGLHLGADQGTEHRLEQVSLTWDRLQATARGQVATAGAMPLDATLQLSSQQAAAAVPAWAASAALQGPLAGPHLQATLRAEPSVPPVATSAATSVTSPEAPNGTDKRARGAIRPATRTAARIATPPVVERPTQSLDVNADLRPFAAWPLGELQLNVAALDLSAFSSAAPMTALSGRAIAHSSALDQPASVGVALDNAAAGRWNEHLLPVRHLAADLAARPDDLSTLTLGQLDIDLGTAAAPAGHLTGQGGWRAAGWTLDAQTRDVQPALIDARAPPMRVNGPISLVGTGDTVVLRSTLVGSGSIAGSGRNGQTPRGGKGGASHPLAARPSHDAAARALHYVTARMAIDASIAPLKIELRSAEAQAGPARASLSGSMTRADATAPWSIQGRTALVDVDPGVWWPGAADSAWRRASSRLTADGRFDVIVPADLGDRPPAALLAALRGQVDLRLSPSVLVGVPLDGSAQLRNPGGTRPAEATLTLSVSGNHVEADGRVALAGNGASDAWNVQIDAPVLDRLAPVMHLFAPSDSTSALAGSLQAQAHLTGRWPKLATQGRLDAHGMRVGPASLAQATAHWQLGTAPGAALTADATLADAAWVAPQGSPGPSLDALQLQLTGTGRAHTLDVQAVSKALPPAWTELLQGGGPGAGAGTGTSAASSSTAAPVAAIAPALPGSGAAAAPGTGTVARLQAQGGFVETAASAWSGWRGRLQVLDVRSGTSTAPLLAARDIGLEALWSGGPARVAVQPGRADVLGGSLRWGPVAWAAIVDGQPGRIDARVDIDPLRIAPLLARIQPGFGWGGDLALGGHVVLHSGTSFIADVVVERSAGDLSLTDELGSRPLGISQLRFGLIAVDGVWTFTPALVSKTVGTASGAIVARAAPAATWPGEQAPLLGSVQFDIASLGTLGPWLPPGWRIDGALHAAAQVGGRVGAPEYTGAVTGERLALRNFLQGVNVTDGELRVALHGDSAHIDRFSAKAGNGNLTITGDAALGAAPRADVQVTASHFQVLGRVDRRIVTSGQARLHLDAKTLALDGRFGVDEGLIDFSRSDAPTLSADVRVVRARGALSPAAAASAADAPPVAIAPGRNVALEVRVTMGELLHIRGHGLDAGLRGEMHVTSPGGRVAVDGSIATADGTYQAYGQKLTIDRGQITFNGPVDNPLLDIEATRPGLDIRVGVAVSGPTSNPRVRLFSEPDLADIDKLSWLVMGKASDGLGRTDTALLQRAALALVSGEGPGTSDKLIKSIGLDELSIGQQTTGDVKDTVVSLGKQLSSRWFVGYERGLNATAGSWQLVYRLAQRLTVRAQAGGDSALDLIWTWRWQ